MPTLMLSPAPSAVARKFAGFHSGNALKLNFKAGETVAQVLGRFNEYRSPENQIEALFKGVDLKERFLLQTPIHADLTLFLA